MIIAKITDVKMTHKAEDVMTARQHREATEWLSRWTCANNIKKVVAVDYEEALILIRKQVAAIISARQYPPEVFEIQIVYTKVEDGYFWEPSSGKVGFEKVVKEK